MHSGTCCPTDARWYHFVWTTYRRRGTFKIPAAARFCERAVARVCDEHGCDVDALRVSATRVHLLVRAPASIPRAELASRLKRAAARALEGGGDPRRGVRRVWEPGGWCATIRSPRGVAALRAYLEPSGTRRTGSRAAAPSGSS